MNGDHNIKVGGDIHGDVVNIVNREAHEHTHEHIHTHHHKAFHAWYLVLLVMLLFAGIALAVVLILPAKKNRYSSFIKWRILASRVENKLADKYNTQYNVSFL